MITKYVGLLYVESIYLFWVHTFCSGPGRHLGTGSLAGVSKLAEIALGAPRASPDRP